MIVISGSVMMLMMRMIIYLLKTSEIIFEFENMVNLLFLVLMSEKFGIVEAELLNFFLSVSVLAEKRLLLMLKHF